jgi:Tol biopolymer transport system component
VAVPFNLERLEVTGAPVPVLVGVLQNASEGDAEFAFSQNGTFVFQPGGVEGETGSPRTLVWVDRNGTETPLPAPPRPYDDPRLSPDGQRVVLRLAEATSDVWVYDIARSTLARLTFEGWARFPLWTPDGKRIVYGSRKPEATGLYWKSADGSGPEEPLLKTETEAFPSSISPDGKTLAFVQADPDTVRDIWILPLDGERKPKPFLQTGFHEHSPMFSPDGRWLAYSSDESGRHEIYVQEFPGPGGKWLISSEGGTAPVWSRNGQELFYSNATRVMVVDITTQPAFRAGTPRMLFNGPDYLSISFTRADYDVSPDGQRFLMVKQSEEQGAVQAQIHVLLNWFEELKRLVPTDN